MKVTDLRSLARQLGMRGHSRLRKDDLIDFIKDNLSSRPPPRPAPRPTQPRQPSVRFRLDRPRQPELLRKLEERFPQPLQLPPLVGRSASTLKPYQLKPKTGTETFIEPLIEQKESPSTDPKKFKRMKKKLDELNRKIRHSRKRHNGLIHTRNSLRKVIEDRKHGTESEPMPDPGWTFMEHEQAFSGAYRSYRVNGRPRINVETFFNRIRGEHISLITRELTDLNSARVQMTTWIRFTKDDNPVELMFNSRMTDVHRGRNLEQIVDEMIAHIKMQIENPVLLNSRFRFDEVRHQFSSAKPY